MAIEDHGLAGVALDEHPAPPESWRAGGDGHDSLDPFVGLAAVAAATERIRLFVYATILPIRNPFLLAKSVATLDVVSEGRLELGLAGGYLPAELEALGVGFDGRNAVFDENLELLVKIWTGRPVSYKTERFDALDVTAMPTPVQQPHPPLWFAGNSKRALRRVAEYGGGWMALPNPRGRSVSRRTAPLETDEDLRALLSLLEGFWEENGHERAFDVATVVSANPSSESSSSFASRVDDLAASGYTWINVSAGDTTETEALHTIEWLGEALHLRVA